MRAFLPNSANLENIETFVRRLDFEASDRLEVTGHPRWIAVHPVVVAAVGALALHVRRGKGVISAQIPTVATTPYLVRMGLFDYLGVTPPLKVAHHEAAGRFIPLTNVRNDKDLANVLADVEPMLHSQVEDSYALRYVLDEMVRNVLEHAASPSHAVVCAQYYPRTRRLALGVADTGVGVRATIRRSHNAPTDHSALQLALRPGVTGTTSHVGGNDMNAGAGLFFTKALAHVSRHNFVLYSGESLFKLLKTDESERDRIPLDPEDDHATWHDSLPSWPGTLVGIDIGLTAGRPFDTILQFINSQYGIDVRRQQHARYKRRPRFE